MTTKTKMEIYHLQANGVFSIELSSATIQKEIELSKSLEPNVSTYTSK